MVETSEQKSSKRKNNLKKRAAAKANNSDGMEELRPMLERVHLCALTNSSNCS